MLADDWLRLELNLQRSYSAEAVFAWAAEMKLVLRLLQTNESSLEEAFVATMMGKPDYDANLYVFVKTRATSLIYTPLAYAVLFFFWLLSGLNFFWLLQQLADGERLIMALQLLFNGPLLTFSLPVVVPLITMRLIAEERRLGTLEAVLTTPISETQIVLAKFISAFIFYLILWLPTLIYCGVLHGLCLAQGVVVLDP